MLKNDKAQFRQMNKQTRKQTSWSPLLNWHGGGNIVKFRQLGHFPAKNRTYVLFKNTGVKVIEQTILSGSFKDPIDVNRVVFFTHNM